MDSNIRASEGMEIVEDKSLPEGELRVKQIIIQSVDGKQADIFEHTGDSVVSALLDKEGKGFYVMFVGGMDDQIGSVNAIVAGVVARIMSYDDSMQRIVLMTALSRAIADGLLAFDVTAP